MTTKVTEQGLLVPKYMLGDAEEVEIRRENNLIILIPSTGRDPILELGQHPVLTDVEDASENHDSYLHHE